MKPEGMNFPVYRKYKNGRSYFKILNERQFEELRVVGQRYFLNQVKALHLPEIQFIHDLIYNYDVMAEEASAEEFAAMVVNAKSGPEPN